MRNSYDILGVPRDANEEALKDAYRKLAKNYHPDRNPGDEWAERRFKEANEAYETLADPARRVEHDAELDASEAILEDATLTPDLGPAWRPHTPVKASSWPAFWSLGLAAILLLGGFAAIVALTLSDAGKIADAPLVQQPAQEAAPAPEPSPAAEAAKDALEKLEAKAPPEPEPAPTPPAPQAESEPSALARNDSPAIAEPSAEGPSTGKEDAAGAESRPSEEAAWVAASRGGAKELTAFLDEHPNSSNAREAAARLEKLGWVGVDAPGAAGRSKRWLRAAGKFRDCADCPEMVVARTRRPEPSTELDEKFASALPGPFAASDLRVTAREWTACVRDGECRDLTVESPPASPALGTSWNDARAYVRWLARRTGRDYRLLTETEWRYVARLKLVAIDANPVAAIDGSGRDGKALEWVADCWRRAAVEEGDAAAGDGGPDACAARTLIGRRPRDFERKGDAPDNRWIDYAFRVARDLP